MHACIHTCHCTHLTLTPTKVIEETKNPCFYETITFDTTMPTDLNLSQNIVVEVWDKNGLGQSNIPVSSIRLKVANAQISKSVNDNLGNWHTHIHI